MASTDQTDRPLRLVARAAGAPIAERAMAEAFAAGALGVEERDEADGVLLVIYAPAVQEAAQRQALDALADVGVELVSVESVAEQDWSETWKEGLEAIVVSDRLVVRPSFVPFTLGPGQTELIVDPGQAFGTGGHASTRLVLDWIDALARAPERSLEGARVLDVGTGSGVLALAAIRLGAERAVGLDLDPVAVREAAGIAADNALADRFEPYVGGIEAVGGAVFDLVVANLLRSEVLPIAEAVARAVAPGGRLVLSGLLGRDAAHVVPVFRAAGLETAGERSIPDPSGERWIAPLMRRPGA